VARDLLSQERRKPPVLEFYSQQPIGQSLGSEKKADPSVHQKQDHSGLAESSGAKKKKYLRLSADQICGTYKSFISQQLLGVARRRVYEKAQYGRVVVRRETEKKFQSRRPGSAAADKTAAAIHSLSMLNCNREVVNELATTVDTWGKRWFCFSVPCRARVSDLRSELTTGDLCSHPGQN
jgi:hypothetical protein